MHSLLIFTGKELREQVKTFKGIVVLVVLALFGMSSPLLAKLLPDIFKMAGTGIAITIPTPTFVDAYEQFFKNVEQMGLIIVLLIYSGSVSGETAKGTAALMLTKRLSRSAFIFAKFIGAVIVWTVSYALSCAAFLFYTGYLFPNASPAHPVAALLCMWLFGIVTLSCAVFAGTLFKSYALSAVTGFCLWGLLLLTSSLPRISEKAPGALAGIDMSLVSGKAAADAAVIPVLTGLGLTALLLLGACLIFRTKEL